MLTKHFNADNVLMFETWLIFIAKAEKSGLKFKLVGSKMNENESDIFVISRRFTEIQEFGFEINHMIESISPLENLD